ncbi:MAG: hypothetical protein PHE84_08040 [bacterium]|nr:hypothetical protein [bacterium]
MRKNYVRIFWAVFFTATLFSCGGTTAGPKSFSIPAGCQPLTLSSCFLPFPSSFYEEAVTSTQSGFKVVYPASVLPVHQNGTTLDPELFGREDGFSPATGILAYFGTRLDPSNLPSIHHPEDSLTKDSLVQLLRYSDGERVPLFAEVDAQAGDSRNQALKIRPIKRLDVSTRYVCVIKKGLKDEAGQEIPVPEPFKSLRDGNKTDNTVAEGYRSRAEENIKFLKKQGLKKSDILLAWDFTTASEAMITGPLVAMRDKAIEEMHFSLDNPPNLTIESDSEFPSSSTGFIHRKITGKFDVPWFLKDDGRLNWGADGKPEIVKMGKAGFVVHVPESAADFYSNGNADILIYGHGLFGTAEEEMWTDYQRGLINDLKMVQVGTDWIGVSKPDVAMLAQAIGNLNQVTLVTERIMQAHVNFLILAWIFSLDWVGQIMCVMAPCPGPLKTYYLGISNGGVQGGTFMALSPDVQRGILNVPGAAWSMMLERSFVFKSLIDLLKAQFPDPLDRQIVLALVQVLFDPIDPINFAPHAVNDPLGTEKKTILVQESYGDALVPNLATETLARTMGLPGLAPLVSPVYGITEANSPLSGSGFTIFNTTPTPLPGDTNAPMSQDNIAHEGCRRVTAAVEQMKAFFKEDGQVVQTCSGQCNPGSGYVPWAPFP